MWKKIIFCVAFRRIAHKHEQYWVECNYVITERDYFWFFCNLVTVTTDVFVLNTLQAVKHILYKTIVDLT